MALSIKVGDRGSEVVFDNNILKYGKGQRSDGSSGVLDVQKVIARLRKVDPKVTRHTCCLPSLFCLAKDPDARLRFCKFPKHPQHAKKGQMAHDFTKFEEARKEILADPHFVLP